MRKLFFLFFFIFIIVSCQKGLKKRWTLEYTKFSNTTSKLISQCTCDFSDAPIFTFDTLSGSHTLYWERHKYESLSGGITKSKEILIELPEMVNGEVLTFFDNDIASNLKASVNFVNKGSSNYFLVKKGFVQVKYIDNEYFLDFKISFDGDKFEMVAGSDY